MGRKMGRKMGRGARTKQNIKNQALELFVAQGVGVGQKLARMIQGFCQFLTRTRSYFAFCCWCNTVNWTRSQMIWQAQ